MNYTTIVVIGIYALSNQLEIEKTQADTSVKFPSTLIGCWNRRTKEVDVTVGRRCPSAITYCLGSGGKMIGLAYDTCDGWDFRGRWSVIKSRLEFKFGKKKYSCSYSISNNHEILTLSDCYMEGIYKFSKKSKFEDFE